MGYNHACLLNELYGSKRSTCIILPHKLVLLICCLTCFILYLNQIWPEQSKWKSSKDILPTRNISLVTSKTKPRKMRVPSSLSNGKTSNFINLEIHQQQRIRSENKRLNEELKNEQRAMDL